MSPLPGRIAPSTDVEPAAAPQIAKNVIANWLSLLATTGVSIAIVPFLLAHIGIDRYGVWATIAAAIGMLTILDVGTTAAVNTFVARLRARDEQEAVNEVATGALILFLAIGGLIAGAAIAFPRFASTWFPHTTPPEALTGLAFAVPCVGIGLAMRLAHAPFIGILAGYQRDDRRNAANISASILRLALTIALVTYWRADVTAPALAFTAATGASLMGHTAMSLRTFPALRLAHPRNAIRALGGVLNLSGWVMVIAASTLVVFHGPSLALARWDGPSSVATYSVPLLVIAAATQGISAFSRVLLAWFSMLDGLGRSSAFRALLLDASRYVAIISFAVMGYLAVPGSLLLDLWVGSSVPEAHIIVLILAAGHVTLWTNSVVQSALAAKGTVRPYAIAWCVTAGVAIAAVLWMVGHGFGAKGAAFGVAVPLTFMHGAWVPYHASRTFAFPFSSYWRRTILLPVFCCLAATALPAVLSAPLAAFTDRRGVALLLVTGTFTLGYIAIAYWLLLEAAERVSVGVAIRRRLLRRPREGSRFG